jgi:tetratricopeptide (TPR) repeat protein
VPAADSYRHIQQSRIEKLLDGGEYLLAYDTLSRELDYYPDDDYLRGRMAYVLSRLGIYDRALELLGEMAREGRQTTEVHGLHGSIYKRLWMDRRGGSAADSLLERAYRHYMRGWEQAHDGWNGINLATTARLLGKLDVARRIASRVIEDQLKRADSGGIHRSLWPTAIVAEAFLCLGRPGEAVEWYSKMSDMVDADYGRTASIRANARLLLDAGAAGSEQAEKVMDAIYRPGVVAVLNQRVLQAGRSCPAMPERVLDMVADPAVNSDVVVGSVATEEDVRLFELLAEHYREMSLVLPGPASMVMRMVGFRDATMPGRLSRLLLHADTVEFLPAEGAISGSIRTALAVDESVLGTALFQAEKLDALLLPCCLNVPVGDDRLAELHPVIGRKRKPFVLEPLNIDPGPLEPIEEGLPGRPAADGRRIAILAVVRSSSLAEGAGAGSGPSARIDQLASSLQGIECVETARFQNELVAACFGPAEGPRLAELAAEACGEGVSAFLSVVSLSAGPDEPDVQVATALETVRELGPDKAYCTLGARSLISLGDVEFSFRYLGSWRDPAGFNRRLMEISV